MLKITLMRITVLVLLVSCSTKSKDKRGGEPPVNNDQNVPEQNEPIDTFDVPKSTPINNVEADDNGDFDESDPSQSEDKKDQDNDFIEEPKHPELEKRLSFRSMFNDAYLHASGTFEVGPGKEIYHRSEEVLEGDWFEVKASESRPGSYKIVNRKHGTCLHASGTYRTTNNDWNIYHRQCDGSDGDYWFFDYMDETKFELRSYRTKLCLHFSGNIRTHNDHLQIYQAKCDQVEKNLMKVEY